MFPLAPSMTRQKPCRWVADDQVDITIAAPELETWLREAPEQLSDPPLNSAVNEAPRHSPSRFHASYLAGRKKKAADNDEEGKSTDPAEDEALWLMEVCSSASTPSKNTGRHRQALNV